MPEFATVTKIELVKYTNGPAVKVCLWREDDSLPPKERYAHDYIGMNAPPSIAHRWFSMLGYNSADWNTFFNQDVFDLIGLRVQADFTQKMVDGKNGQYSVIDVKNIAPCNAPSALPAPPAPTAPVTSNPQIDDEIPF